jgi:sphingomyelin phosphodiesterase
MTGSGACWSVWSNQFQRIIDRYSDIIKGQWYGHSHEQDYKLTFEADTGRPISVSYVGGSGVTDGMNSAFNVYWADGERNAESTWEIINHETWVLDLTPSNALPDDSPPIFRKILNAREMYKMKSLVPEEVHSFINRMVCDDDLFLEYQK